MTVSGRVSSSIVVRQSTKGTSATMARKSSGAALATAPMSSPPADPPPRHEPVGARSSRSSTRWRAQATKSREGVGLGEELAVLVPAAAELAAAADVRDGEDEPRSSRLRRSEEKTGSMLIS